MSLDLPTHRPRPSGVANTNDDAQASKLSCVQLGYFQDEFVHHFVKAPVRRAPLINRGYYARQASLRQLVTRFLACLHPGPVQVVSLGAGFDTLYWQLVQEGAPISRYIELDMPQVCMEKAGVVARTPALLRLVGGSPADAPGHDPAAGRWLGGAYRLAPADLRSVGQVVSALGLAGLDPGAPTLVLAECVLVYLEREESDALLRQLSAMLSTAAMLVYEQVRPDDAFGKQMLLNLSLRGCPLLGICWDVDEQAARLRQAGWERAEAAPMDAMYRGLEPRDRRRIETLEIFDEFEEWDLIQAHYCIAMGVQDKAGRLQEFGLPRPGKT
ncbi:hypothetical protein ACKKBG_A03735 [Auxenochlorella protothecoides x Auxenochlorella symbiontica]|uniref:Leucine carboxyl methyltransferase 1 homolog n=1 Tax=Auxenochlorella protothecoides TaxID=3075 RepID=A0A1D2A5V7_AUXPR